MHRTSIRSRSFGALSTCHAGCEQYDVGRGFSFRRSPQPEHVSSISPVSVKLYSDTSCLQVIRTSLVAPHFRIHLTCTRTVDSSAIRGTYGQTCAPLMHRTEL